MQSGMHARHMCWSSAALQRGRTTRAREYLAWTMRPCCVLQGTRTACTVKALGVRELGSGYGKPTRTKMPSNAPAHSSVKHESSLREATRCSCYVSKPPTQLSETAHHGLSSSARRRWPARKGITSENPKAANRIARKTRAAWSAMKAPSSPKASLANCCRRAGAVRDPGRGVMLALATNLLTCCCFDAVSKWTVRSAHERQNGQTNFMQPLRLRPA